MNNHTISESRVDDIGMDYSQIYLIGRLNKIENSATRIPASWYLLGQDCPSYPPTNFDTSNPGNEETNLHVDVQDNHYNLVRRLGAASTNLLKNERGALPLGKKDRTVDDQEQVYTSSQ
jgi:hypothetical protein